MLEVFPARKVYESRPLAEELDCLNSYIKRKLKKHYSFKKGKIESALQNKLKRDKSYWLSKYALSNLEVEYFSSLKRRRSDPSFQKVMQDLDNLFFVDKLRLGSVMASLKNILSAEFDIEMTDEVCAFLEAKDKIDPIVDLYRNLFLSITQDDEGYFHEMLRLLRIHQQLIDPDELRELYLLGINYCAQKIRTGKKEYYTTTLNLYKEAIENRSLFEGKYLSHWTYTNVAKLAINLKQFDFLEAFITDHADDLQPNHRIDAENLNRAELLFHKKEFDGVFDLLNKLIFSDVYYTLASRILLIKAHYAKNNLDSMLSQLAAFTMYLRRNLKLSPQLKKPYLNFCLLLSVIMRSKPNKKEIVKARIQETNPLTDKTWLLETLENELG